MVIAFAEASEPSYGRMPIPHLPEAIVCPNCRKGFLYEAQEVVLIALLDPPAQTAGHP